MDCNIIGIIWITFPWRKLWQKMVRNKCNAPNIVIYLV